MLRLLGVLFALGVAVLAISIIAPAMVTAAEQLGRR